MANCLKRTIISGIIAVLLLGVYQAQENQNDYPRLTGYAPPSEEEISKMPHISRVDLNWLGFKRVNEIRTQRGKSLLSSADIKRVGKEVESLLGESEESIQATASSAWATDLPASVDNSKLKYFPPIRSQGNLNSCTVFSSVYYQLSYMKAFQLDLDIRDDNDNTNKYSPKWVYNMVNGGLNGPPLSDMDAVMENHGVCTWAEFPYDGDDYLSWCLDSNIWRSALNVRTNPTQSIAHVDTDSGLLMLKELLNNGYIIKMGAYIFGWVYSTILNDPSTPDDDSEVGKEIAFWVNGWEGGGHAMVIVGYNDEIWTDINGNGIIDTGEKGALRIANSWGTWWKDEGFIWLAYDALKAVSLIPGAPTSPDRKEGIIGNHVYVLTTRENYSPYLIAEFTVNHARRDQMLISLGVSDTSTTSPSSEWDAPVLQNQGGPYAFNGSEIAVDGTFVLDITDKLVGGGSLQRYYLGLSDNAEGNAASLTSFKIVDLTTEPVTEAVSAIVPQIIDNAKSYGYVDYAYSGPVYNHPPYIGYAQVYCFSTGCWTTLGTYSYLCTCDDQDGDAIAVRNVIIDGISHEMYFWEFSNNMNWYRYDTTLPAGTHEYDFCFEDEHGTPALKSYAGKLVGPTVTPVHMITTPTLPDGELEPIRGRYYEYRTSGSVDDMGHDIQYRFDWGDGTMSDWLDVGIMSAGHTWSSCGPFPVKAQSRCSIDLETESAWSMALAVYIPYTVPFTEAFPATNITLPPNWSVVMPPGQSNMWFITERARAGGEQNEVHCAWRDVDPGTTRLITPPINTTGYSVLNLSFKHYLDSANIGGIQLKIQTSPDGETWTDESWSVTTGIPDIGPETIKVPLEHNLNIETTYIAFVIMGPLNHFQGWDIDDISITQVGKLRWFVKDVNDYYLWMNTMLTDESFEGWQPLQGGTSTAAAVASFNERLHLIVRDAAGDTLWYQNMDSEGAWSGWVPLGGSSPSTPSMAVFNNKLYVAIQEVDNRILCRSLDTAGTWSGWTEFPGATSTTPVLAAFNGKLHLVVKDLAYNYMWWNSMDTTGTWSGWDRLIGESPSPVAMTEYNNRLYMFVRGNTNDLYYRSMDTSGVWGDWTMMVGGTSIAPSIVVFNGKLYLVVKDVNGYFIWMRSMDTTQTFGDWTQLEGGTAVPIALVKY